MKAISMNFPIKIAQAVRPERFSVREVFTLPLIFYYLIRIL